MRPSIGILRALGAISGTCVRLRPGLLEGMNSAAKFLAKVALGMVGVSVSSSGRVYSVHERPDERLYDLRDVHNAYQKHLAGQDLNDDERKRVTVVAKAVGEMLAAGSKSSEASGNARKANQVLQLTER